MLILFSVAALVATAPPIPLDRITLDQVRTLDGKPVVVTFIVGKPLDLCLGRTIVGAADHPDGSERGAHLARIRLDVDPGQRIGVFGVMRVLNHAPAFVGGQLVPGWVEIRVTERN